MIDALFKSMISYSFKKCLSDVGSDNSSMEGNIVVSFKTILNWVLMCDRHSCFKLRGSSTLMSWYPSRSLKNPLSRSSVVIWYPAPKNVFSIASNDTQPSLILKRPCPENWNHTSFNLYKFGSTPCCKSSIAASHLKYGPGIFNVVGWFDSNTLPLLYKTEITSNYNTCKPKAINIHQYKLNMSNKRTFIIKILL